MKQSREKEDPFSKRKRKRLQNLSLISFLPPRESFDSLSTRVFRKLQASLFQQNHSVEFTFDSQKGLPYTMKICGRVSNPMNSLDFSLLKHAYQIKKIGKYPLRSHQLLCISNVPYIELQNPPLGNPSVLQHCHSLKIHLDDLRTLSVENVYSVKVEKSKLVGTSRKSFSCNLNGLKNVHSLSVKLLDDQSLTDAILQLFGNVHSLYLKISLSHITNVEKLGNLFNLKLYTPLPSSVDISSFGRIYSLTLTVNSFRTIVPYSKSLGNVHDLEISENSRGSKENLILQGECLTDWSNIYSVDLLQTDVAIYVSSLRHLQIAILKVDTLKFDEGANVQDFENYLEISFRNSTGVVDPNFYKEIHSFAMLPRRHSNKLGSKSNLHCLKANINSQCNLNSFENVHDMEINIDSYGIDFSPLNHVHTLSLTTFLSEPEDGEVLYDANSFSNVHTLLLGCGNLTDVSQLGNVHHLDLSYCDTISDVSSLGNVHTLILTGCNNITDVSQLGHVHTLDLSGCNGIHNVGHLGNVHTLNLSKCWNVWDVENLFNVYDLSLTDKLEVDVWCNHKKKFKGIAKLVYVPIIHLCRCIRMDDYPELLQHTIGMTCYPPTGMSDSEDEDSDGDY